MSESVMMLRERLLHRMREAADRWVEAHSNEAADSEDGSREYAEGVLGAEAMAVYVEALEDFRRYLRDSVWGINPIWPELDAEITGFIQLQTEEDQPVSEPEGPVLEASMDEAVRRLIRDEFRRFGTRLGLAAMQSRDRNWSESHVSLASNLLGQMSEIAYESARESEQESGGRIE